MPKRHENDRLPFGSLSFWYIKKENVMKRKVLIVAFCCALITVSIVHCGFVLWAAQEDNPNPENKMAYTIYAYPQFVDLPNAFTAYSMDIYIENSAPCTHWSFANFNLYLSEKNQADLSRY